MKINILPKLLFLLLIVCFACNNKTVNGVQILPIDSVAVLVADCYFIESEIHVKQQEYDMKDYAFVKYDSLFAAKGITKKMLTENVRYYFTHEKYAEIIMNKVDTIVEHRAAALRDSLNAQPQ